MATPAFKEWSVIVEALGAGDQMIILRKGGIAEGRGGFQVKADRFWLFPTSFHAQVEKTKPAAAKWVIRVDPALIRVGFFAEIVERVFLDQRSAVEKLDRFHYWTETTVRERFEWSKPVGLHLFIVRIHRLNTPIELRVTPEMAGCKSWVELPLEFSAQPSVAVLDDELFARRRQEISRTLTD